MRKLLLLRGVNVSGHNRIPMAALRDMLAGLGLRHVETYLQSGNAVFDDPGLTDLTAQIAPAMTAAFGFTPALFVFDAATHAQIAAACPYQTEGAAAPNSVHVWYLAQPAQPDLAALRSHVTTERFHLSDRALYLHAPEGIGRSALAARMDRALKTSCTARNWRTVLALEALLAG
jgi:uncharacterized protein (DUF1697 family)